MLFRELKALGLLHFVLGIYSDDLGIGSPRYNAFIREVSTDLGCLLGFVFKAAKDVEAAPSMDFIGYEIDTSGARVGVRAKAASRDKLRTHLDRFLAEDTVDFQSVEAFMGLWGHAARVNDIWRVWQNPVY